MEVSNTVTLTQLALICVLSSFLLAWMVTSLWLAVRPGAEQQTQREEIQAPLLSPQIRTAVPPKREIKDQVQLYTPSRASDPSREVVLEHLR